MNEYARPDLEPTLRSTCSLCYDTLRTVVEALQEHGREKGSEWELQFMGG